MPRRTAWPALASLDRRFSAEFRGDQLANLFPENSARALIRRGILADAGLAWTVGHCICEHHHDECAVRVDVEDGVYWGYCNEAGRRIEVSPDLLQRYRFAWEPWAAALRRENGLDGPGPVLGAGALYVGSGTVAGREYGLVVVAPGCRRAADVVLPEGARKPGRTIVALLLGEPIEPLPVDATVPATALQKDFATIDGTVLENAIDAVPQLVRVRGEAKCVRFSNEVPRGGPIDEREYKRLLRPEVLKEFGIFIDLLHCKVWRKGRPYGTVLDGKGRSTGRSLGQRHLSLLADYVTRPEIPMVACDAPTYRRASVEPRSAAAQLNEVRRSVHGKTLIRTGRRSAEPGQTTYVFSPGGLTWCVLDRLVAG